MSLLDDIKAKADANGDGKITLEDLESLKGGDNDDMIEEIKKKFLGSDGKFDMKDITDNFEGLKAGAAGLADKAKDALGDMFGGDKQ